LRENAKKEEDSREGVPVGGVITDGDCFPGSTELLVVGLGVDGHVFWFLGLRKLKYVTSR
jgi:hypothetical protein